MPNSDHLQPQWNKLRFIRRFFLSSNLQFYWSCAHCRLGFLFLADTAFCCCSPSASMCCFTLSCFSAHQGCTEWLPSYHSLSVGSKHSFNSRDCCENPSRSAVFKPACLAPPITPQSPSSHFFPFWCLMWALTRAPDLCVWDFIHCSTAAF